MDNHRTGLPTLQRRLRHLHSIAARNVAIPLNHGSSDLSSLELYFTLHQDIHSSAFYTSEKIKGSSNPTWKSLNVAHLDEGLNINTASQTVTVRVWFCYGGSESKPCIVWDVHFSGLVLLANRSLSECAHDQPNTLIFGIHGNFYGAPPDSPQTSNELPVPNYSVSSDAEQPSVRNSYSLRTLQRIQTILCAIKQTQNTVQRVHKDIDQHLNDQLHMDRKFAQREQAVVKVNLIRGDLQWRLNYFRKRKEVYEKQQLSNLQQEVSIRNKWEKLKHDEDELRERKKRYFDIRDELIKTGAHLVLRRKQLMSELAFIYPIVQMRLSSNVEFYTICGVRLPHAEDFAGHDEMTLAVALGFTCHLVAMIGNYLDIPLHYPMDHRGSRSVIYDHILDKLADNEREFPLFGKGKEKFQFHYGVYLLNKNIAQLRHYCGMHTQDLRLTLENVSSLLCDKLGVVIRNDAFTNQHSLIPPSFGGPRPSSVAMNTKAPDNLNTNVVDTTAVTVTESLSESPAMSSHGISLKKIKEECAHDVTAAGETSSDTSKLTAVEEYMLLAEPSRMCAADMVLEQSPGYLDSVAFTIDSDSASIDADSSHTLLQNAADSHRCANTEEVGPVSNSVISDVETTGISKMLENGDKDVSGLLCRTAAVSVRTTFKTHAMTQRLTDDDPYDVSTLGENVITESGEAIVEGGTPFEGGALVDVEPTVYRTTGDAFGEGSDT